MAPFISMLLLIKVLYILCLFQSATCQAIDKDAVDFSIVPGWTDLHTCVRNCFGECEDCPGPAAYLGCGTNRCMCQPSQLFPGLQYVESCVREDCGFLGDVQVADYYFIAYCSLKGYTKIKAATLLPTSTSATDSAGPIGGFYTLTVSEITNVYMEKPSDQKR